MYAIALVIKHPVWREIKSKTNLHVPKMLHWYLKTLYNHVIGYQHLTLENTDRILLPSESTELILLAQKRQTMNTITDVQLSNLESQWLGID